MNLHLILSLSAEPATFQRVLQKRIRETPASQPANHKKSPVGGQDALFHPMYSVKKQVKAPYALAFAPYVSLQIQVVSRR